MIFFDFDFGAPPVQTDFLHLLAKHVYDSEKFTTTKECIICRVEFDAESQITPLPCNIKHYFHTECVTEWLRTKQECPLCRHKITTQELESFQQEVERLLQNEEAQVDS